METTQSSEGDFWRERAEQLEGALDSRITIEQAKGVLAERLGLDIDGAFSVLRGAARSDRAKLHELARAVVASNETPVTIIRFLARHPSFLRASSRDERAVRTEQFFRRVNETMRGELGNGDGQFLCECGNIACNERLALSAEDLRVLHSADDLFAILPGHEIPEIETGVTHNGYYAIVQKRVG